MNPQRHLLVASSDDSVLRRLSAAVSTDLAVHRATGWNEVVRLQSLYDPVALVVDVTCDDVYQRIDEWFEHHRDVPLIALGPARSDRMLYLDRFDVFAEIEPDADHHGWRQLLRLVERLHRFRIPDSAPKDPPPLPPAESAPARGRPSIIAHVAAALRHFEHMELLLDRAVEGLATSAQTTRAGVFSFDEAVGLYRLKAGQRTLRETNELTYRPDDPLVLWFERHAHMVTRTMAGQLPDPAQRIILSRALDLCGAEVVAPLQTRGRLLGWFFVGFRSTGQPYDMRDLEEFSLAADYLSMLLENATLYREVAMQKSMAETLLHALPTGIIAVDGNGVIRWFGTAAQKLFGRGSEHVTGKPVEVLGTRLADAVRRALQGHTAPEVSTWEEPSTRRYMQVDVQRLDGSGELLGAVVMIQDLTSIRHLQEKQAQVERAAFWTDLAAGLSHEIRNPLVTISTFAQLLPERYQDEEFRDEFSKLVTGEIGRLDGIINQINDFAHPPEPVHTRVDVRNPLQRALHQVFPEPPGHPVRVESHFDGNLPMVQGDERALTDCFSRLFQNAKEAIADKPDATIRLSAVPVLGPGSEPLVEVSIKDNGRGIPSDVLDKIFSPFYTTKARGMGLGLPIAKRTVIDHNGRLAVDSSTLGTSVTIQLPVADMKLTGSAP